MPTFGIFENNNLIFSTDNTNLLLYNVIKGFLQIGMREFKECLQSIRIGDFVVDVSIIEDTTQSVDSSRSELVSGCKDIRDVSQTEITFAFAISNKKETGIAATLKKLENLYFVYKKEGKDRDFFEENIPK